MNSERLPSLNIPALLKKYGLRPSKGLGQNFLTDENHLHKVVQAAEISERDVILEIGSGLGSLTRLLAIQARRVIAVELDKKLLPVLHETLSPFDNVEIVMGDILALDPAALVVRGRRTMDDGQSSYKVVANIPYYITSALIRHLLEAEAQPTCMVLTIQKEVAERICEQPPRMSLLALSVQVYGKPHIRDKIPAGAFYPAPKVDSTVVKIDLYPKPMIPIKMIPIFFRLAKAGFSQKRKTLRNTLSAGMAWSKPQAETVLAAAQIDPQRRAQTLNLEEWKTLTECVAKNEQNTL